MSEEKSKKSLLKRLWADRFVKRSVLMVLLAQLIPFLGFLLVFFDIKYLDLILTKEYFILYYLIVNLVLFSLYIFKIYIQNPAVLYNNLRQSVFVSLNFVFFVYFILSVSFWLFTNVGVASYYFSAILIPLYLLLMIFFFIKKEKKKEKFLKIIMLVPFTVYMAFLSISLLVLLLVSMTPVGRPLGIGSVYTVALVFGFISSFLVNYFLKQFNLSKKNNFVFVIIIVLIICFCTLFAL